MNRRGFLKMIAGGAAAVGAAFALPRTTEDAVTAPAAPSPLADAQPVPEMAWMPAPAPTNALGWQMAEYHYVNKDGSITPLPHEQTIAFPDYDERFRLVRDPIYVGMEEGFAQYRPGPVYAVLAENRPKPSADLVDW